MLSNISHPANSVRKTEEEKGVVMLSRSNMKNISSDFEVHIDKWSKVMLSPPSQKTCAETIVVPLTG